MSQVAKRLTDWAWMALSLVGSTGCVLGDYDSDGSVFGEGMHQAATPRRLGTQEPSGVDPSSRARHVILVIGDGMPMACEVAASRYLTGTDDGLCFHSFPTQASVTTWDITAYNRHAETLGRPRYAVGSIDPHLGYDPALGGAEPYPLVPDNDQSRSYFLDGIAANSASTATAMSTGLKTDLGNISWLSGDPKEGAIETIAQTLRRAHGMAIGVVTTSPLSDATPAAFLAHSPDRGEMVAIAREILTQTRPDLLVAGGGHPDASFAVDSGDLEATRLAPDSIFVGRTSGWDGVAALQMAALSARAQDQRLVGLFGGPNGRLDPPIAFDTPGQPVVARRLLEDPPLPDIARTAIQFLAGDPQGFFLLVEEDETDDANHNNDFATMIGAMVELDQTVQAIIDTIDQPGDELDWTNTTLFVTSDHANAYLRLPKVLQRGDLPTQQDTTSGWGYPDGEVTYGSRDHTNELVRLYAKGRTAAGVGELCTTDAGQMILDNTAIYRLIQLAAGR